jgi:predicted nucleotidyltransferase component of viral defense system
VPPTDTHRVESFHLHVLRLLGAGREKAHVALKGGCNIRFFFGSVRYSADMDLDVGRQVEPHALRDRMQKLLSGPVLGAALRAEGVDLGAVTAPKQTDTTQRWKIALVVRSAPSAPLHTKIEFSRRPTTEDAVLEAVDPAIVSAHRILPLLIRHYPVDAALRQKVRALVGRATVQARDVFDLALLFSRTGGSTDALRAERAIVSRAIERAMDVSFDEYRGQVVAYLLPDHAEHYGSRKAWDLLQAQVVASLERAVA